MEADLDVVITWLDGCGLHKVSAVQIEYALTLAVSVRVVPVARSVLNSSRFILPRPTLR